MFLTYYNLQMRNTFISLLSIILLSCANEAPKEKKTPPKKRVETPSFNEDSAYNFIAKQVAFGPRVPNTSGHEACSAYLIKTLSSYCDTVIVQEAQLTAFDGTVLDSKT